MHIRSKIPVTPFEKLVKKLSLTCQGINTERVNILTHFLLLNADVHEKPEWCSPPSDNAAPEVPYKDGGNDCYLRLKISKTAVESLVTYYNKYFPKLHCRYYEEKNAFSERSSSKPIFYIAINATQANSILLPLLEEFLKNHPEIVEEFIRDGVINNDFYDARTDIFDPKGISTDSNRKNNCLELILCLLINEFKDDNLPLPAKAMLILDKKDMPIKLNDSNNNESTYSFSLSKRAEKVAPKIVSFFNHIHPDTAKYQQSKENSKVNVRTITLMERKFLNAIQYKAGYLHHNELDYFRKQSDRIKYTREECVKKLTQINEGLKSGYKNSVIKAQLQNKLSALIHHIKVFHPDNEDIDIKTKLHNLLDEVQAVQKKYLVEQNLYFPKIKQTQKPVRNFMGGYIQQPPLFVPDPRTPQIFNEIEDYSNNLRDISNKKFMIHDDLPRGAVYSLNMS